MTGLPFLHWLRHDGTPIHQGAMSCRPSERGAEPPSISDTAAVRGRDSMRDRERERIEF